MDEEYDKQEKEKMLLKLKFWQDLLRRWRSGRVGGEGVGEGDG